MLYLNPNPNPKSKHWHDTFQGKGLIETSLLTPKEMAQKLTQGLNKQTKTKKKCCCSQMSFEKSYSIQSPEQLYGFIFLH